MHDAGNICSAWFLDIRIYKLAVAVSSFVVVVAMASGHSFLMHLSRYIFPRQLAVFVNVFV